MQELREVEQSLVMENYGFQQPAQKCQRLQVSRSKVLV